MLSVLIPTYNYDCRKLVNDIWQQCVEEQIMFEILVFDDCSDQQFTVQIQTINLPNVKTRLLNENIGRARIRNLLAESAQGDWLMFIDCDAQVIDPKFITNYINNFADATVVVGGTAYNTNQYKPELSLRLKYGLEREGNRNYNKSFTTFNFCIKRQIFNAIQFDNSLSDYGHEDTVFGIILQRNTIEIKHIDNPLLHCGLDTNTQFLDKIKQSNSNLLKLYKSNNYPELKDASKLLHTYTQLEKWHLTSLLGTMYKWCRPLLYKNLISANPNLRILDMYKLGELCSKV